MEGIVVLLNIYECEYFNFFCLFIYLFIYTLRTVKFLCGVKFSLFLSSNRSASLHLLGIFLFALFVAFRLLSCVIIVSIGFLALNLIN